MIKVYNDLIVGGGLQIKADFRARWETKEIFVGYWYSTDLNGVKTEEENETVIVVSFYFGEMSIDDIKEIIDGGFKNLDMIEELTYDDWNNIEGLDNLYHVKNEYELISMINDERE